MDPPGIDTGPHGAEHLHKFSPHLNDGTESSLHKFTDDTKLGGEWDMSEGRGISERPGQAGRAEEQEIDVV